MPPSNDFDRFLEKVPKRFKEGPWSLGTWFFFATMLGLLIHQLPQAVLSLGEEQAMKAAVAGDDPTTTTATTYVDWFRAAGCCYGVYVLVLMVRSIGLWPFASYTVTSWNLLTLRLGSTFLEKQLLVHTSTVNAVLGSEYGAILSRLASGVSSFTKFPALAGCTITVTVWWGVLVPLIDYLLKKSSSPDSEKHRAGFRQMNSSWLLVNLHLLNLPLVVAEFFLTGEKLHFHDLYFGLALAMAYLLFYLCVLDANGIFFYIILTPRPWWSFAVYTAVLGIYIGIFFGFNEMLTL